MINTEEELPRGDIKTSRSIAFPPTPFLLVENNRYFVVESWKESDIQALRDCKFMQNIIFEGHDATTEEIKKFSVEEDIEAKARDGRRKSDEK